MKKLPIIVTATLPLLIGGSVFAQSEAAATAQAEMDASIFTLLQEHEESELGYAESYAAFKPRFIKIAAERRGTEVEVRANLWLMQQAWWLRADGKMEETAYPIAKDLIARHPDSFQLGLIIEYQYVLNPDQRQELFNELIKVSTQSSVKAAAHFGLARIGSARNADGEPNKHFAALLNEYADESWRLSTFGAIANAYLNPHSKDTLAVGQHAPEIIGVDHQGNPMTLADFRGKVVMLDFWGHW